MTGNAYTIEQYAKDLRQIAKECSSEDEIISRVAPLAQRLALNKSWLLPEHFNAGSEQGFGVHLLHEEADHSLPVFAVSWLPGRGAPPHDHGTWAVVAGVEGVEKNTRYKRVDDRNRADYAKLEVKEAFDAAEGELVCMKTGGIHSVVNESNKVTLSLHTYGMHVNYTERSQFNLETNEKKDFKVQIE